jgi:maleamate amidohydrolase
MRADDDIYRLQGFGGTVGIGRRPALCVVDFVNGFTDPAIFGGGNIAAAVARTRSLLAAARRFGLPIAFSRVVFTQGDDFAFLRKVPALAQLTEHATAGQIVEELSPLPHEKILRKTQPSAFFGTGYADWLREQGVDTVVVADCVGDRSIAAHEANLFDMEQKYADLVTCEALCATLLTLIPA